MRCATCGGDREHTSELCGTCGDDASLGDIDLAPGTILGGDLEIGEPIAVGGMGVVYRGVDHRLERAVAIKVLPARCNSDARVIERFQREAKAVAAITHSNIVPIYTVGSEGGAHFFVMKLIEGMSLADLVRRGPMDVASGIAIMTQICDGLSAIHGAGCVHRDVKPSNIMVEPSGHVTLLDFGILREERPERRFTRTGLVVGTPAYMAPEQAKNAGEVDPRSDIYSLGVVMFEMFTGRHPFVAATPFEVLMKHASEKPVSPTALNARIPAAISKVVLRALAKGKDERFASAAELKAAVVAAGQGVHSSKRTADRAPIGAAVVALVAIVAIGVVATTSPHPAPVGETTNEPASVPAPAPVTAPASAPASATATARPTVTAVATATDSGPRSGPGLLRSESRTKSRSRPDVPAPAPTPAPAIATARATAPTTAPASASTTTSAPTPAPARASAPSPAPAPATLTVVALEGGSFSWAEVSIDQGPFEATPLTRKLAPGAHRIDWRRRGFRPGTVKVVLESGESLRYPIGLLRDAADSPRMSAR